MNKKIFLVALAMLIIASAVVFAQVCLTNAAASVTGSGNKVTVRNKMNNQPINVEIFYKPDKKAPQSVKAGSVETGKIDSFAVKEVTLPANTEYSGEYTVWSCY